MSPPTVPSVWEPLYWIVAKIDAQFVSNVLKRISTIIIIFIIVVVVAWTAHTLRTFPFPAPPHRTLRLCTFRPDGAAGTYRRCVNFFRVAQKNMKQNEEQKYYKGRRGRTEKGGGGKVKQGQIRVRKGLTNIFCSVLFSLALSVIPCCRRPLLNPDNRKRCRMRVLYHQVYWIRARPKNR